MGRAPCCDKASVKKGPWSPEEDAKLKDYMEKNGTGGNWIALPQKAGLRRCGKSCRLRWLNYLRPNIKHGEFSDDEDRIICTLFASIGSRWSIIAAQLPGRTDNDIKNYWNTKLKKKLFGRVQSQTKPHQNQIHHATSTLLYNCSNNTYQTPATSFSCFGPPYSSTFSNTSASCLTATSILQPQPQESLVGPVQHYQLHDNNGVRIFGGEASCCSSSDGSCSNIQTSAGNNRELEYSDGDHHQQVGIHSYDEFYSDEGQKLIMASDGDHGWSGHQKSPNGLWGETETPLDYGIEEIKQLISTTSSCNSFVFDENKADENVMYY
ncbi:hypothetical protein HRI_003329600 [Hibiscus trionum]|uniref:Uncharacterized protein n=1 Tax=Hibiscus trionum TaxID=183268 RepID=A0A9W7MCL9_HIBTR|nr:hypothetical protein HRI_003329600 [Hibiscus trionum]